jgi:CTP:molybdopterin cytidylyltransferase MocA
MSNWRLQNLIGAAILAAGVGVIYGVYKLLVWAYHLF